MHINIPIKCLSQQLAPAANTNTNIYTNTNTNANANTHTNLLGKTGGWWITLPSAESLSQQLATKAAKAAKHFLHPKLKIFED